MPGPARAAAPRRPPPPPAAPRLSPAVADDVTTPIAVQEDRQPPTSELAGSAAATLLAAGIGCAAFGVAVVAAESIAPVKQLFTLSSAVGPLSGKAVAAVVIYLVAWLVLHLLWRTRTIASDTVLRSTAVVVGIGLLGTFPPVYGLIAGH